MKLNMKNVVTGKWDKIYVGAVIVVATLLITQPAFADTALDLGCTTTRSWNVPEPLVRMKNFIADPIKWIQIASALALPLLLLMIFLKFKGAKGRQEKIEEAFKMLWWTIGIDIGIFSVMWASSFIMGKIC